MTTISDPNGTALFSLDRLYKAAAAYYFWRETGFLLGSEPNVPTALELEEIRKEMSGALIDTRLTYYPFSEQDA